MKKKTTIILSILGAFVIYNAPKLMPIPESEPKPKPPVVEEEPVRTVLDVADPNEIIDTFYNNELDGNKKYFDKWIKTTANFREIDDGLFTGFLAYFNVRKSNGFTAVYGIVCEDIAKNEKAKISGWDRGQTISIVGLNKGLSGSVVVFEKCEFNND